MMRTVFALVLLVLLNRCSPLKQYPQRSYEWAMPEIDQFKKLNEQLIQENALLFIGSSSIRMWSSLAEDMAPYPVIQRGYGGAHLRDAIFFVNTLLAADHPQMIICFIANDIKGDSEDESPSKIKRLFKFFLKQVRSLHPDTPFLWVEITPTKSRWSQWKDIQNVNAKIKAYCDKTPNLYFVKTSHAFLDKNELPKTELFREDQLHLNSEGYAIWSKIIKKAIDEIQGK